MANFAISHKYALDGGASKLASLRLIGILCNLHERRRHRPVKSLPGCAKIGGRLEDQETSYISISKISRDSE